MLLPGSVAADIVFYGLHLAGKLPVLLNWTTGPANLAHAVKTLNVRYVITSKKLIDRLGIQIEGTEYVYLEDIRGQIGKLEAAMTMLSTYLLPGRMLLPLAAAGCRLRRRSCSLPPGSESTPKAVPLSHRNLLTNLRACAQGPASELTRTCCWVFCRRSTVSASWATCSRRCWPEYASPIIPIRPTRPGWSAPWPPTARRSRVTTPTFLSYMFGSAGPTDLALAAGHRRRRGKMP